MSRRRTPTVEELESRLLHHGGNISALAEELGVARNTVYRWVGKLGIDLNLHRR